VKTNLHVPQRLTRQRHFPRGGSPDPPRNGENGLSSAVGPRSAGSEQAPTRRATWRSGAVVLALALVLFLTACGAAVAAAPAKPALAPDRANTVTFPPVRAQFVRFLVHASAGGQPCIDELEVYGPDGTRNLALAEGGAKATASSCLPGYAIHQVAHLNDGLYGNDHSWIAAGTPGEWAQIELPRPAAVAQVVFSRDREGRYRDRMPESFEILASLDGVQWKTVARVGPPTLCLLYTSPSPRDRTRSRMPSSA